MAMHQDDEDEWRAAMPGADDRLLDRNTAWFNKATQRAPGLKAELNKLLDRQ